MKHLQEEAEFASRIPAILPAYCEILNQDSSYVVKLQDLDSLQENLETLLVRSARTERLLHAYIEDKKEKKVGRPSGARRGRGRGRGRGTVRRSVPNKRSPQRSPDQNLQKALALTNDVSRRFWDFVAPYCRDLNEDDIEYLEYLQKQSMQIVDTEIPEKGDHYSLPWDVETVVNVNIFRRKSSKTPKLTAKSAAARKKSDVHVKMRHFRNLICFKNGLCLENRLRSYEDDDFVLQEIEKCHKELESVRQHNIDALSKLRENAEVQMNLLTIDSGAHGASDIKEEN